MIEELLTNPTFQALGGATVIGGALYWLRSMGSRLWTLARYLGLTVVEVNDQSQAFYWLSLYLERHPYTKRARQLSAKVRHPDDYDNELVHVPSRDRSVSDRNFGVLALSPGQGLHFLWHDGKPFLLTRASSDPSAMHKSETFYLTSLGRSRSLVESIFAEAKDIVMSAHKGRVAVQKAIGPRWGQLQLKRPRSMDTIFLTPGVKEELYQDILTFREREGWYADRGLPWRRGFLLHGAPGCGKSSLAFALAGALGLPLCELNLSAVSDDASLSQLMENAPVNAIILIEDIDAAFVQRDSQGSNKGLTFAGLLNVLDGVSSQEGRTVIMTTNHPEKLDPALIRPGRVDKKVEIGPMCENAARGLFLSFFPETQVEPLERFVKLATGMTPAVAQGICLVSQTPEEACQKLPSPLSKAA